MHPMTATRYDCIYPLAVNQAPCCMCRYMCELGQASQAAPLNKPAFIPYTPGHGNLEPCPDSHQISQNFR